MLGGLWFFVPEVVFVCFFDLSATNIRFCKRKEKSLWCSEYWVEKVLPIVHIQLGVFEIKICPRYQILLYNLYTCKSNIVQNKYEQLIIHNTYIFGGFSVSLCFAPLVDVFVAACHYLFIIWLNTYTSRLGIAI